MYNINIIMVKGTLKKHFFHRYLIALLSLFIFQNSFGQDSYRFKCKDNPKCNGVEFSINIPKKFNPLEGDRPHIIKKFVFQENNFSTTHNGRAGIIVDNSGINANEIYNNTFDNLAIGTQAQGVNAAGVWIVSKSSNLEDIEINVGQGLQFLCNQYFNVSS